MRHGVWVFALLLLVNAGQMSVAQSTTAPTPVYYEQGVGSLGGGLFIPAMVALILVLSINKPRVTTAGLATASE